MQNKYISEWLNIPALQIRDVRSLHTDELHIDATPLDERQNCPLCLCNRHLIRKGSNGMRTIQHIPAFENRVFLHVPALRMYCNCCKIGFSWTNAFVGPKQQHRHVSFPYCGTGAGLHRRAQCPNATHIGYSANCQALFFRSSLFSLPKLTKSIVRILQEDSRTMLFGVSRFLHVIAAELGRGEVGPFLE